LKDSFVVNAKPAALIHQLTVSDWHKHAPVHKHTLSC